jgi:hypothetical protein
MDKSGRRGSRGEPPSGGPDDDRVRGGGPPWDNLHNCIATTARPLPD